MPPLSLLNSPNLVSLYVNDFSAIDITGLISSKAVTWNGAIFCLLGFNSDKAYTSPDGVIWTERTLPSVQGWAAISWDGTRFLALDDNGFIGATSLNGIAWLAITTSFVSVQPGTSLANNGVRFVNPHQGTSQFQYSPTGATGTWTSVGGVLSIARDVAWNGNVFCVIGSNLTTFQAITSPDGAVWTFRSMPQVLTWVAIAALGTIFFALASDGTLAISNDDGITWSTIQLPVSATWTDITYDGNLLCAIGNNNACVTSPDGFNWSLRNLINGNWQAVSGNGDVFVIVGSQSTIALSKAF